MIEQGHIWKKFSFFD